MLSNRNHKRKHFFLFLFRSFPSSRPQSSCAGACRSCQGRPSLDLSSHSKFPGRALTTPSTTAVWMSRGEWRCHCHLYPFALGAGTTISAGSPFSTRSTELRDAWEAMFTDRAGAKWPQHGLGVSTPLCPERTDWDAVQEESRGRRGPSRQGRHPAHRSGEGDQSSELMLSKPPPFSIGTLRR